MHDGTKENGGSKETYSIVTAAVQAAQGKGKGGND